jgi:hypothetical protein
LLCDTNTEAVDAALSSLHVHQEVNMFQHIACVVSDLPKPDLLQTMQIGMFDTLLKRSFNFMKTHEPLDTYNVIWLSVSAYHDRTQNKRYMRKFIGGMGR